VDGGRKGREAGIVAETGTLFGGVQLKHKPYLGEDYLGGGVNGDERKKFINHTGNCLPKKAWERGTRNWVPTVSAPRHAEASNEFLNKNERRGKKERFWKRSRGARYPRKMLPASF